MKAKKTLLITLLAFALVIPFALSGCGNSSSGASSSSTDKAKTVKIGIVGSDDRVWKIVQQNVKKQNINLKIVKFTDYNQPNIALANHSIDLNAFQHQYFLDNWNKAHNSHIVSIGDTVLAPLGLYSKKIKSVSELKKGDEITIPNDATNEGRALNLLASQGLITLNKTALPTPQDITGNKLNLKITPLDATQTPRTLTNVAAAIVNNGIAIDAKLDPNKAIAIEKVNKESKPYINIIAANKEDADNAVYKKIVKAYQTNEIKDALKKFYKGSTIPVWDIDLK